MKIIESQSAVLTNYEVLAHLSSTAAKPRTTTQTHQNVSTVLKELNDYLSPPSTSRSPIPRYGQHLDYNPESVRALVAGLQPYNLTKPEVLMIANLRPLDLTLLDCVVEECDERFSQEQQEGMLRVVRECLGGDVGGNGEVGEDGEGEDDAVAGMAEARGDA